MRFVQSSFSLKFDKICFTGGSQIGKIVAEQAGKNLVPCVLELGGRNPCIVDQSANVRVAARKIAYGRFANSGQICTAPDMVFVHSQLLEEFIRELKEYMET